MIRRFIHILLTVLVLAAGLFVGGYLIETAPKAKRILPEKAVPVVEVIGAQPRSYTVVLESRGTVKPRTESTLLPQVAGRVLRISENFRDGAFFEAGEELLRIDPVDYELTLTTAKADLAKARLALKEELARARQAESDWKRLGIQGKPDALVLRKPQLANARAALAAAEAKVKRAEVDLQRTRIKAPYAGRVMEQLVDVGQTVSPSTALGKIYAVDYVEVRLPLTDRQLAFIDLPENFRGETPEQKGPPVELIATLGGKETVWQGRIVRTEGTIDTRSRQLFVIAQVVNPYARYARGRSPLKIGQFVRARIQGRELKNVYVLPRSILVGTDSVLIVDKENRIHYQQVEVVWQDHRDLVIQSGLTPGDRIIATPMPFATEGAEIRIAGSDDPAASQVTQAEE